MHVPGSSKTPYSPKPLPKPHEKEGHTKDLHEEAFSTLPDALSSSSSKKEGPTTPATIIPSLDPDREAPTLEKTKEIIALAVEELKKTVQNPKQASLKDEAKKFKTLKTDEQSVVRDATKNLLKDNTISEEEKSSVRNFLKEIETIEKTTRPEDKHWEDEFETRFLDYDIDKFKALTNVSTPWNPETGRELNAIGKKRQENIVETAKTLIHEDIPERTRKKLLLFLQEIESLPKPPPPTPSKDPVSTPLVPVSDLEVLEHEEETIIPSPSSDVPESAEEKSTKGIEKMLKVIEEPIEEGASEAPPSDILEVREEKSTKNDEPVPEKPELFIQEHRFLSLLQEKKYEDAENLVQTVDFSRYRLRELLNDLQKTELTEELALACNDAEEILNKTHAIQESLLEEHVYTEQEILKIATFTQGRMKELAVDTETKFDKATFGLVRSLYYDKETDEISILHKSKIRKGEKEIKAQVPMGHIKKAKPVSILQKDTSRKTYTVMTGIELVPYTKSTKVDKATQREEKKAIQKDIEKEFNGMKLLEKHGLFDLPCFQKTHKVLRYKRANDSVSPVGLSILQERGIDLIDAHTFTMKETKTIFKNLLMATSALHEKDLVHWDIRPENVLLTQDEGCRLADFEQVFNIHLAYPPPSGYGEELHHDPLYEQTIENYARTCRTLGPKDAEEQLLAIFKKMDSYATGATLYFVLFSEPFPEDPDEARTKLESVLNEPEHDEEFLLLCEIVQSLIVKNPHERGFCKDELQLFKESFPNA